MRAATWPATPAPSEGPPPSRLPSCASPPWPRSPPWPTPSPAVPGAGPGGGLHRAALGGAGRPAGEAGGPAAPPDHGGRAAPGGPGPARLRADQDRRRPADGDAAGGRGRGAGRAPGRLCRGRPGRAGVPAERGSPIRRSNFTRRVWIPTTRAAGVEGLRFHDLRHTAATLAVAAGASTRELMVRMGHSSSAAALRYQHVMAGRDAAIAAALDELIQAASMIGRGGRELGEWLVGLPGLEPGPSSLSEIDGQAPCYPAFAQAVRLRQWRRDGVNHDGSTPGQTATAARPGLLKSTPGTLQVLGGTGFGEHRRWRT
jgi:hypothetical protein